MNPLRLFTRPFTSPMWRWPTVLGLLTAIALVAALMADGPLDLLAALALGLPVAVVAGCVWGHGLRR